MSVSQPQTMCQGSMSSLSNEYRSNVARRAQDCRLDARRLFIVAGGVGNLALCWLRYGAIGGAGRGVYILSGRLAIPPAAGGFENEPVVGCEFLLVDRFQVNGAAIVGDDTLAAGLAGLTASKAVRRFDAVL